MIAWSGLECVFQIFSSASKVSEGTQNSRPCHPMNRHRSSGDDTVRFLEGTLESFSRFLILAAALKNLGAPKQPGGRDHCILQFDIDDSKRLQIAPAGNLGADQCLNQQYRTTEGIETLTVATRRQTWSLSFFKQLTTQQKKFEIGRKSQSSSKIDDGSILLFNRNAQPGSLGECPGRRFLKALDQSVENGQGLAILSKISEATRPLEHLFTCIDTVTSSFFEISVSQFGTSVDPAQARAQQVEGSRFVADGDLCGDSVDIEVNSLVTQQ